MVTSVPTVEMAIVAPQTRFPEARLFHGWTSGIVEEAARRILSVFEAILAVTDQARNFRSKNSQSALVPRQDTRISIWVFVFPLPKNFDF